MKHLNKIIILSISLLLISCTPKKVVPSETPSEEEISETISETGEIESEIIPDCESEITEESEFVYGIYRVQGKVIGIFSKDNLDKELKHDGYIAVSKTCS